MEWNARAPSLWDWENLVALDGKVSESPKHIQATDWGIEGDTGIDNESVYSSGGGGCPGSKSGNGSSSKSFMMASIDSSSSGFNSQTFENCGKDVNEKKYNGSIEGTGTSSPDQVASVGVGEPLIGLKLGKRTYFEDVCAGNGTTKTSSFSVVPTSSTNSVKKTRAPCQSMQNPRCQVEGCNLDLCAAKDYHRRHRVCETHSKYPKVVIAGLERRFCQQCSRFHDLSEFDEKKRSCRRRLSHHNARRRKPQTDMITLNSARLSSPFYDGRQQVNFALNRVPIVHALSSESPSWEGSRDYKLAQAKGSWVTTAKVGGVDGQLLLPRIDMPNATSTIRRDFERPYMFKGNTAQILNQGLEPSVMTSNLDETPDVCRALSLLSNNSWGSADSEPASFNHFMHMTGSQPAVHAASQGFLLNSEYWVAEQPSAESRSRQMTLHNNSNQFQEFQLFKTPYDSAFFSNHHMP